MKILALHLGGTIACTKENSVLSPNADITAYFKAVKSEIKGVSFVHRHPVSFLSEHLDGALVNLAVKEAKRAVLSGKYAGIIVTHGSDTLAYTSCALAYALGNDCIPVVTVCSDLPLSDFRSSGHINLRAATALIALGSERGVFSVYRSSQGEASVFRASRLIRHKAYEGELSCSGEPYGKVSFITPSIAVFTKNQNFSESTDELSPLSFKLSKKCPVAMITVYPSMVISKPTRLCRALILSTYHSGTLDTENPSIKALCAYCKRRGIPVFADGIGANGDYESMLSYASLGIRRLPAMSSPVAMFMKLWALISCKENLQAVGLSLGGDIQP